MTRMAKYILGICVIFLLLYSCKPADYYYGEYLANGELYYPGRIDSLSIIPGNQRAKLRLRITTDRQTAAGAIVETRHWRNVRTAQGSVAANGCPPRGEDQSNRDEFGRNNSPRVFCGSAKAEPDGKPYGPCASMEPTATLDGNRPR
jgi:uncharacterized membrane protein